jgi:WD40 repeat protein
VALKVIKAGMDSRQVIARFEAERQALALMDHPNIARVLDAGTTRTGVPYFVMELVKGVPITKYCDAHHLTPRERLELFIPVCQAVQHAHQKGIIHRDLKPSNVLIAQYDGRPVPKVIDFGVAKATGSRLTERTMYTEFGAIVGTLEYMSPEQAEQNQLDVDTRSDIYSLGVLLYELLTGTTPLDRKRLKDVALLELLRAIKEDEPPKPSTRLSTTDELPSIAANRNLEPKKLSGLIRGELDWIVMKALEKDRSRRYETANGFAMDIQRYLSDEPVSACPPSAAYRMRKFARRNSRPLAAVAILTLALVTGTVVSTWQAVRATHAEALAETRLQTETEARKNAVAAQSEAEAARRDEAAQRAIAVARRNEVESLEQLTRQSLYAANITLADQNLEKGEMGHALSLLEAERAVSGRADLRGFEWYHLWWRCHQGHRLTLRCRQGNVSSVAYSPNGSRLASAGSDGTVMLWDAATGSALGTFRGHTSDVCAIAFSPDGKTLVSAGNDGQVLLWNVATGAPAGAIEKHVFPVVAVAFSPTGESLATGETSPEASTARIWEVATKSSRMTSSLPSALTSSQSLAFFPDEKTLAVATYLGVRLCDASSGQVRSTFGEDRLKLFSVALSPDGRTIAAAGTEGVKLIDAQTGQPRSALNGRRLASCVAFSPDAKYVALGTELGTVVLWNPETGQTRAYGHRGSVRSVAFAPGGNTLASGSDDRTVKVWDLTTQTPPLSRSVLQSPLWCAAFSPDGNTAALAGDRGTIELRDTITMQKRGEFRGHIDNVIGVAFSPDGRVLASCSDDATIRLWNPLTRHEEARFLGHEGPVYTVAFSPDGKTLASGGKDATVRFWDVPTRSERATLRGHTDWIWTVNYSPDGKILASGCDDGTIRIWDTANGQERLNLRGHTYKVRTAVFSRDGKTLFSTDRKTIRSWDVATGAEQKTWRLREGLAHPHKLVVLSDSKTLAIGSIGSLIFWDITMGRERAVTNAQEGSISSVAISADGRTIATTSFNGSAKLWPTATEADVLRQATEQPDVVRPIDGRSSSP